MGTFRIVMEIGDSQGQRWETLQALVDTGSTFTWIPRDILERLGIQPEFSQEFQTADGRVIERDMAETRARLDGRERVTIVVFGGEGDVVLLGAYTLEGFSLAPDPVNQRLVPVRGLALAIATPLIPNLPPVLCTLPPELPANNPSISAYWQLTDTTLIYL